MNKRTAKRLKAMPAIIMAAAVFTGIMAAGSTSADAKPSVKLDGEYHAALGVRTGSGKNIYRMAYYHKKALALISGNTLQLVITALKNTRKYKAHLKM